MPSSAESFTKLQWKPPPFLTRLFRYFMAQCSAQAAAAVSICKTFKLAAWPPGGLWVLTTPKSFNVLK
jgi:hypothetical protein